MQVTKSKSYFLCKTELIVKTRCYKHIVWCMQLIQTLDPCVIVGLLKVALLVLQFSPYGFTIFNLPLLYLCSCSY
jgi:hypothetical protein